MPRSTLREPLSTDGIQAVGIAMRILERLALGVGYERVTDLAREIGTTKNRVFRHLKTLEDLGYVRQEPDTQRYMIGVRFVQIGSVVANQYDFVSTSRPIMQRLRDAVGFSVVLSKVEDGRLFAVEQVQGHGEVTFSLTVGNPLRLHNSAQGKIVLAFGDPSLLEATLAAPLTPRTASTIVDAERLRNEVERVRQQGWAIAPGEIMSGINALAVPIFDHRQALLGTLATIASIDELPGEPSRDHLTRTLEAAAEISGALPVSQGRERQRQAG